MMNRKIGIIAFLLCFFFALTPFSASAAFTYDALEPIIPEKECSLTLSCISGETEFSGVEVKLYKVATVSEDFKYTLSPSLSKSGVVLDGIKTAGEWNVARSTLEAYVIADNIAPDLVSETNDEGLVFFDDLKTGMYLAIIGQAERDGVVCVFDSALIAVPGLGDDGLWQYDVLINAKGEVLPPVEPDEEKELKIVKLWRGDEGKSVRPKNIEVEIFCDGISYKTVTLSAENDWSYSFTVKDDGSSWAVIERNVPSGYTMTLEERGSTFVITNTLSSVGPDDPGATPDTGDTSNTLLYIIILGISGVLLIALGVIGKKRAYEEKH